MERKALKKRIESYNALDMFEIKHAIEIIGSSNKELLSNEEIGNVWHRISQALDVRFSDDEKHDAWSLEAELKNAYQYEK